MRPIILVDGAGDVLRTFPEVARQRVGYSLWLVQLGEDPPGWKPMPTAGPACREIQVQDDTSTYQAIYTCTETDHAVWVLHCADHRLPSPTWPGSSRRADRTEGQGRGGKDRMEAERHTDVWRALEKDPTRVEDLRARAELMNQLARWVTTSCMTQFKVARWLRVSAPRISDLMHGRLDLFSVEVLESMLAEAGPRLDLYVGDNGLDAGC